MDLLAEGRIGLMMREAQLRDQVIQMQQNRNWAQ